MPDDHPIDIFIVIFPHCEIYITGNTAAILTCAKGSPGIMKFNIQTPICGGDDWIIFGVKTQAAARQNIGIKLGFGLFLST